MKSKKETEANSNINFALGEKNYVLLAIAFVIIVIGFLLMVGGGSDDPTVFTGDELFSFRRIVLAPVVVLFGFVFGVYAIMKKPKE
jgi:hypothetical protein